ncbi:metal ABC transporter solute-binding protein, Zn/Mn family [Alkalibacillus aidingensis]|uniref:metal ABC transporter solute-binding protein, Zn/Mn family n=1 Tax=Alkalibacillus aidingensis TaxID=2747607 RepID=UPI00166176FA|nr:zinc ABC transporter substrate-binding protein [Alkalibacillus aidingensis]
MILLLTLIACGNQNNPEDPEPQANDSEDIDEQTEENDEQTEDIGKIITSLYPIEYIVSEIVGDFAEVETVMPPGADAHVYEPSTRQMIELADSDAFFYIGETMEVFSDTMANSLDSEGVHTFELAKFEEQLFMDYGDEQVDDHHEDEHGDEDDHHHEDEHGHEEEENDDHDHEHGDYDPHFWLDPSRMISAGDILLDELITLYPNHEEVFRDNYEQFTDNMEELDTSFQEALVNEEVNILVAHAAFSYWEEAYGINQISIRGVSSSQEPSQRELQQLFETLEDLNIDHVILESNRDDRLAETVADEFNLDVYHLHNLETRTEENVEHGLDYMDIMRENLEVLIQTMED